MKSKELLQIRPYHTNKAAESQHNLGQKEHLESILTNSLVRKGGFQKLDQVIWGFVPLHFKYHPGWRFHSLSRHLFHSTFPEVAGNSLAAAVTTASCSCAVHMTRVWLRPLHNPLLGPKRKQKILESIQTRTV